MSKSQNIDSLFTMIGVVWVPGAKDLIHAGTLKVERRPITFTTAPKYNPDILADTREVFQKHLKAHVKYPAFHAFTPDGICTLCDVVEMEHEGINDLRSYQSLDATIYYVSACVFGMYIQSANERCLASARYSFIGLNDWFPKSTREVWTKEAVQVHVPLIDQEFISFKIPSNQTDVSIKLGAELKSSDDDSSRLHRSVASIEIRPPSAESLSWFIQVGNRLENFFSLVTGTSLALEALFIYRGEEHAHVVANRKSRPGKFNRLESVQCRPDQLEKALCIWLSTEPAFESLENLASGVIRKGTLFVETEFLSLAQALEGVHRATVDSKIVSDEEFSQVNQKISALLISEEVNEHLQQQISSILHFANGPTFRARVGELCDLLSKSLLAGMQIERDEFAKLVVKVRNCYTHMGDQLKKECKIEPLELFLLNQKMRALLRGALLRFIGIPEEQFSRVLIQQATCWR